MTIVAREDRAPLWAAVAPVLYLLACGAAARAVFRDSGAEIGLSGVFAAMGLLPAFALPVVFGTCKTKLSVSDDGLVIGARTFKIADIRLQRADRGAAKIHVVLRSGQKRSFSVERYEDAYAMMALLPPSSAPAGALAA